MSAESMADETGELDARYEVEFTGCVDEVHAVSLDEACEMAECLAPRGQRVARVEGPDGCRTFEVVPSATRMAA